MRVVEGIDVPMIDPVYQNSYQSIPSSRHLRPEEGLQNELRHKDDMPICAQLVQSNLRKVLKQPERGKSP